MRYYMRMINLTNQKFGKILVLERDYSKTNAFLFKNAILLTNRKE